MQSILLFRDKMLYSFHLWIIYDSINNLISSSTVPIPAMPKVSIRILATFVERKPGSVGPRWIFLTPRYKRASHTITAFCSYQAILNAIGSLLISSSPNASLSLSAITARE